MAALAFAIVAILTSTASAGDLCEVTKNDFHKKYDPPPPGSPPRRCLNSWEYNRRVSVSTRQPLATLLNQSQPFRHALGKLTRHFSSEYARVQKLLKRDNPLFVERASRDCGLSAEYSELIKVNRSMSRYGWGVMGEECTTQLYTELDESVVDGMHTYIHEVNRSAKAAVRAARLGFQKPTTYMEFQYKGDTEVCSLLHFVGYRVRGSWRVQTGITNLPLNVFAPDRQRHYLVEILRLVRGRVAATLMTLPRRPFRDANGTTVIPRDWVPRTTTLLASWGGSPSSSSFRSLMVPASNPAIQRAIAQGADTREQVQHATAPSNVAIMLVPLLLTVVPAALFADIGTRGSIMYALVTDVLSALPLAIKGEELRRFGRRRRRATTTWVYGGRKEGDLAAAETWHAECKVDPWIAAQGILFIVLAMVLMGVGIGLELFFKNKLRGRKLRALLKQTGVEGIGKQQMWEKCSSCDCENPDPSSSDEKERYI